MTTPETPIISRRRLRWLAAPAVAVLLTAGCGNDDDDPAVGDGTTTTADVDGLTDDAEDMLDDAQDELDGTSGEEAQAELEAALRDAGLTNLATAVSQVDLSEVLDGNEFTVFAPDDSAFLALDSGDLNDLMSDPNAVLEVLQNHLVVGERMTADDLADESSVTAESGNSLTITESAGTITVDGATVTDTVEAGDGIIHVIDSVLLPAVSAS
jgi:uncharacterized surface protein with fasciclin (FAS1) repeats